MWKLGDADVFTGSCNKRLVMGCTYSIVLLFLPTVVAANVHSIPSEWDPTWAVGPEQEAEGSTKWVCAKLALLVTGKWLSSFSGGLGKHWIVPSLIHKEENELTEEWQSLERIVICSPGYPL